MTLFTYSEAISFLNALRGGQKGSGLERVRCVLHALDNPHEKIPVIHVAGTNGKGSTCALLNNVLQAAGYRVGMFTSPHLIRYNERMAINSIPISDGVFARQFSRTAEASESVGVTLSFFECLTVMAYDYFAHENVHLAIIETGIGGRLDATNVITRPVLSVITAIGFDHTELLGCTLSQIASEKAGIIKENCPVAVYPTETLPVFEKAALLKQARLYSLNGSINITETAYTLEHTVFSVETDYFKYRSLTLPLLGGQQIYNASQVLLCIAALRDAGYTVKNSAVYEGFSKTRWPCRFEVYQNAPVVVLDGAHNEDGARFFRISLGRYFPGRRIILLAGMLHTKDIRLIGCLAEKAGMVVCTQPPSENALEAAILAEAVRNKPVIIEPCYEQAFSQALELAGFDGVVAVAGSLYLAGAVMKLLEKGINS